MRKVLARGVLVLASFAAAGTVAARATSDEPAAVYWITAETTSGMAAMSPGQAMAMLAGRAGAPSVSRMLRLQLSSTLTPSGAPVAEHLPPAGLKAGARLPLTTPRSAGPAGDSGTSGAARGRVLLYWGCGARARPGQPKVIDLARPGTSAAVVGALNLSAEAAPGPGRGRTYGVWPDERGERIASDGSLAGDHQLRGNYAPDIRLNLSPDQDFLPPLVLAGTGADATGAVPLRWGRLSRAQGYFVSVIGANDQGDTVVWTSSEPPLLAGQLPDHLSSADLPRLIRQKTVLGPDATACAVPAEAAGGAGRMLRVVAFGGAIDFGRATTSGAPGYAVKVRYVSTASAMLGMDDGEEDQDGPDAEAEARPDPRSPRRPGLRDAFKLF